MGISPCLLVSVSHPLLPFLAVFLRVQPLGDVSRRYNIGVHFYADDLQVYLPLTSQDTLLKAG